VTSRAACGGPSALVFTALPAGCRFHTRCPAAQERCSIEVPVLRHPEGDRAPERVAACHFAEDVLAGRAPVRSLELYPAG
jgi:ABC-type antimicrobial peptide transport system ATPase subunit